MPEAMQKILETLKSLFIKAQERLLTVEAALQGLLVLASFFLALLVWKPVERRVRSKAEAIDGEWVAQLLRTFARYGWLIPFMLLCQISAFAMGMAGKPTLIIGIFTNLSAAWFAAQILRSLVPSRFWGKMLAYTAWAMAALHILGLLEPVIGFLDGLGVTFGETRLTALVLVKGVLLGVILLQAAAVTSRVADQRITHSSLSPSLQVLFVKTLRFGLFAGAGLVVISSMGISMTSFAVFSGAVGVGIGFGLQKIFSNLVSGVILLLDRSIKPGDTIEVQARTATSVRCMPGTPRCSPATARNT